jgi:hypothetical protein
MASMPGQQAPLLLQHLPVSLLLNPLPVKTMQEEPRAGACRSWCRSTREYPWSLILSRALCICQLSLFTYDLLASLLGNLRLLLQLGSLIRIFWTRKTNALAVS